MAGDIDIGCKGIEWAIKESKRLDKKVIYVAGNHEHYGKEYYSNLKQMRECAEGTDVYFLENDEVQIDDVRILGCTLWSSYDVVPSLDANKVMDECAYAINDHRVISVDEGNGYFSPILAKKTHHESVKWLTSKLNEETNTRATLVVTHHGPSDLCQHINYPISAISGAFHSDLNELVSKADCWVYGHTHSNIYTKVKNCRLIANQAGYPSEDVTGFNSIKVIEV